MHDGLSVALKELALEVKRTIGDGISRGIIKPGYELYQRWKIDSFQYTDRGVTEYGAHGEYITKPSWLRAAVDLRESVKKSVEYDSTLSKLTNFLCNADVATRALDSFVGKLIDECLHNPKLEEAKIDTIIKVFSDDIRQEPVKCGVEVELLGIVLRPSKVEPLPGITLRQIKIEDLEKERPVYGFMEDRFLPTPSAILNIEFLGRGSRELQRRVEQSIAILRLFKVGSVKYTTYHMYSDSITDGAHGTIIAGRTESALETCLVTEEDVQKLKNFWQTMSEIMPSTFFDLETTKTDYLTIAYNRYCDALFLNAILERRIANAVMGLEALFLKSGELQELPYRLSFRVCKSLCLLGHDPYEIKKIVGDAYKIRNLFAHGGHLSYEQKKRIESRYKDVRNFLLPLLEYLRLSIIVMMCSGREKGELIDLIDDSFVDKKREAALSQILSRARDIIS